MAAGAALSGDGVRLSVVHVAPPVAAMAAGLGGWEPDPSDPLGPPRRWLEDRAATIPGAIPVLLGEDEPSRAALEWLDTSGVDLAVVAPHNGGLQRLLLGSFANDLVYRSPVDVMVVPPDLEVPDEPAGVFGHVVCCVDGSPSGPDALRAARAVADASGADLSIVTVVSPTRPLPRRVVAESLPIPLAREERAQALLAESADAVGGARVEVLAGPPEDTVRDWAATNGADLIVVGPRSGRRPGLGGFSADLIRRSPSAVLLARAGAQDAGGATA